MAKFFVKSLWPRWSNWLESDDPSEKNFLAAAVARHLASHVHAALLDEHQQKAHPEEWFFVPPIHTGVRTGDIVRSPEPHGLEIVITPRCDLATGKRKTIQLASCQDVSEDWARLIKKRSDLQRTKLEHMKKGESVPDRLNKDIESADNKCRAFTQHRSTSSLHFLPQMKLTDGTSVGPLMINFDQIRSGPVDAFEKAVIAGRIASVSSEFIPSIVERLGTFFSRIGTPDYSDKAA